MSRWTIDRLFSPKEASEPVSSPLLPHIWRMFVWTQINDNWLWFLRLVSSHLRGEFAELLLTCVIVATSPGTARQVSQQGGRRTEAYAKYFPLENVYSRIERHPHHQQQSSNGTYLGYLLSRRTENNKRLTLAWIMRITYRTIEFGVKQFPGVERPAIRNQIQSFAEC